MAGAIELKAPNGVDKFRLEKTSNTSKTIDADNLQDTAGIQSMINTRSGSDGAFSFRNKIVDGRFDFWYEGTTQTTSGYGSDTMWVNGNAGSTKVHSQQILTPGVDLPAIEVPSAIYFSRTVVTSVAGASNFCKKIQFIENVQTLAGKIATLSFYAKADSAKNIAIEFWQNFGSGGSSAVSVPVKQVSLDTVWTRYAVTFSVPTISSKTIATNSRCSINFWFDAGSSFATPASSLGQQSGTFDIACVQLEEGSVATPFEELPIEVSQMRVNRYYETGRYNCYIGTNTNTVGYISGLVFYKSAKRSTPAVLFWGDMIGGAHPNKIQLTDTPTYTSNTQISTKSDINFLLINHTTYETRTMIGFYYVADARL